MLRPLIGSTTFIVVFVFWPISTFTTKVFKTIITQASPLWVLESLRHVPTSTNEFMDFI